MLRAAGQRSRWRSRRATTPALLPRVCATASHVAAARSSQVEGGRVRCALTLRRAMPLQRGALFSFICLRRQEACSKARTSAWRRRSRSGGGRRRAKMPRRCPRFARCCSGSTVRAGRGRWAGSRIVVCSRYFCPRRSAASRCAMAAQEACLQCFMCKESLVPCGGWGGKVQCQVRHVMFWGGMWVMGCSPSNCLLPLCRNHATRCRRSAHCPRSHEQDGRMARTMCLPVITMAVGLQGLPEDACPGRKACQACPGMAPAGRRSMRICPERAKIQWQRRRWRCRSMPVSARPRVLQHVFVRMRRERAARRASGAARRCAGAQECGAAEAQRRAARVPPIGTTKVLKRWVWRKGGEGRAVESKRAFGEVSGVQVRWHVH